MTRSCCGKHPPPAANERVCFAACTTVWVDVAVTDDVDVECIVMNLGCTYSWSLTSASVSSPLHFVFVQVNKKWCNQFNWTVKLFIKSSFATLYLIITGVRFIPLIPTSSYLGGGAIRALPSFTSLSLALPVSSKLFCRDA